MTRHHEAGASVRPAPLPALHAAPDPQAEARQFLKLVERVRGSIEPRLAELWANHVCAVGTMGRDAATAIEAARSLCMRGGKRLRAALVVAGYRACGGEGPEELVADAGLAVELLQTYLLIHDDWMDGDDLRRGGPSVHAALRTALGTREGGDSAAILAGDYVSAMALGALLSVPLPPERRMDAAEVFTRMHCEVIVGQLLDTHAGGDSSVETIHDLKTGSYTVRGPLLLGAALAGASQPARASLIAFAGPLGLAFQLRDDLLGTFGDPGETGKPAGNDLRAGKRTALVEGLEQDPHLAPLLRKVHGVEGAPAEEVAALIRGLEQAGIRHRLENRVQELVARAQRALAAAPLTVEGTALLRGAAQVLGHRNH